MEILEMSLVMGMMLSVFLTLGFYVLRGIFYVPFIRRRLVETAEREGAGLARPSAATSMIS